MNWIADTVRHFLHHVADSSPWLAFGAVAGIALERWLKPEWAEHWLQTGRMPVLSAAVAGALLPGCAMATVPMASSLKRKGAAVGTLTAFIMIAPILSPHTLVLNAAMLGWPMTAGRIVLPLFLSVALGWALNALAARREQVFTPSGADEPGGSSCCGGCDEPGHEGAVSDCGCDDAAKRRSFAADVWRSLRELLPYFLIGLLAVSLLEALVPHEVLARTIGSGPGAVLIAATAGIPLYVCDGGEIPLTLALLKLGAGPGPAFAFLLSSVGTCLPTILMARRIIGAWATAIYVGAWLLLSIGGGLLFDALAQ